MHACPPPLPCVLNLASLYPFPPACRISDPTMGGAYLTLLNTVANIGVTVPKLFIFAGALCRLSSSRSGTATFMTYAQPSLAVQGWNPT